MWLYLPTGLIVSYKAHLLGMKAMQVGEDTLETTENSHVDKTGWLVWYMYIICSPCCVLCQPVPPSIHPSLHLVDFNSFEKFRSG